MINKGRKNNSIKPLTSRERQVAERYAQGENYKTIAETLFISPSTVRSHLERIYEKLGVRNKAELFLLIFASSENLADTAQPAPNTLSRSNTQPTGAAALPTLRHRLIGREQELREIIELLQRPEVGLVTLTGPGGSGKTRLGLQVARELLASFHDQVYFISLASVRDPDLVASTIAKALALQESLAESPLERLKSYLHSKTLLLVLDNFEQILAAAIQIAELLTHCAGLKVLVTSRAALLIRDEYEYPVRPLALPDHSETEAANQLANYAAITLFAERATAIQHSFTLNDDNAATLAAICIRVDGLPLAIELAAARLRLLSPQALLKRLDQRLPLLTGGARDLPSRQQTLRATIAWSYDLLSYAEQRLFHTLSVFFDGCSLNAIEVLCQNQDKGPSKSAAVLDELEPLLAMNMLRQSESVNGDSRYTMLETIREFGLEQLETSGELAALRRQHAHYFLNFLEESDPRLRNSEQAQCLNQLEEEYANIRAALSWSLELNERVAWGLRMSAVLGWFWRLRGYLGEGREWLERMLVAYPERTVLRSKLLTHLTLLTYSQGENERAIVLAEESVAIAREADDPTATGWALHALGRALHSNANYRQASAAFGESLECFHATDDIVGKNYSSRYLGDVKRAQHDYQAAAPLMEDAIRFGHQSGDTWAIASAYLAAGCLAYRQEDFSRASDLLKESLSHYRHIRAAWGMWFPISNLGTVAAAQGYTVRAVCLAAVDQNLRQRIGANMVPSHRADYDAGMAIASEALSKSDYSAAWGKGGAMSTEQAVDYALSSEDEEKSG